jgi:hypothetical protein
MFSNVKTAEKIILGLSSSLFNNGDCESKQCPNVEQLSQNGTIFRLPGEAGKPGHLQEGGVTPTEGKTIRLARASLANGGV